MAILFVTSTHIGDAVLSTGLLAWLLDRYPDDGVTIACGAPAAKVMAAAPRLEKLHVIRKRSGHRHWLDLWRAVAGRRWRIVVDLRRSALPWLLLARQRAAQPKSHDPALHRVALIARTLGLPPQDPVLWTRAADEAAADALLGPAPAGTGDPADAGNPGLLAIAPGASWPGKTWPTDRFAALAQLLTAPGGALPGARVLAIGAEGEREAARPLLQAALPAPCIDALGLDVLATGAALRRCRLMVGNDSAMMHVAAASGCPTVGLFGPTRDRHYGPWGANGLTVRTPETVEQLIDRPDYDTRTTGSLMTGLTVPAVEVAIRARWPALA